MGEICMGLHSRTTGGKIFQKSGITNSPDELRMMSYAKMVMTLMILPLVMTTKVMMNRIREHVIINLNILLQVVINIKLIKIVILFCHCR